MKTFCVDDLDLPFFVVSDRFGILARRYHATQLPLTVVIDPPTGRVRWLSVGFRKDAVRRLERAVGMTTSRRRSSR